MEGKCQTFEKVYEIKSLFPMDSIAIFFFLVDHEYFLFFHGQTAVIINVLEVCMDDLCGINGCSFKQRFTWKLYKKTSEIMSHMKIETLCGDRFYLGILNCSIKVWKYIVSLDEAHITSTCRYQVPLPIMLNCN